MAIILYPTTDWNGFTTVSDCDTFATENIPIAQRQAYEALQEADKEIQIKNATTQIRLAITLPQTLEKDLQYACNYLAVLTAGIDTLNNENDSNLKSKKIDGVIEKTWFSPNKEPDSFPSIVDSLLGQYGVTSDGSFGFKRG